MENTTVRYILNSGEVYIYESRWDPFMATQSYDALFLNPEVRDLFELSGHLGLVNSSIGVFEIVIPTANPCQSIPTNESELSLTTPLPSVNTSQCPELRTPNIISLPGYLSLTAATCLIYPSVQNYFGSVVNGKLEEQAIGDPIPLETHTEYPEMWQGGNASAKDLQYYVSPDPCIVDGVMYSAKNMTNVPGGIVGSPSLGPGRCLYGISYETASGLIGVIGLILSPPGMSCTPTLNHSDMICHANWWLESLYNKRNASFQSISQAMSQMTKSLTDQIRMNGLDWNGTRAFASGTAYRTDVCNHFIWQWLFFPLAVLVGVAILLIAIIVHTTGGTQGRFIPVWKSLILPTLFYGLEEGKKLRTLEEEEELIKIAKTTRIRFDDSKAGWKVIEEKREYARTSNRSDPIELAKYRPDRCY